MINYRFPLLILIMSIVSGCVPISPDLVYYREISPFLQTFDSKRPVQWPILDSKSIKTEIIDDTYQVTVLKESVAYHIALSDAEYFDHVRIDTDIVAINPELLGYSGVLCKGNKVGSKWTEFYRILINTNGSAEIDYYNNNQEPRFTVLGFIKHHRAINTGDQLNHLRAECVGSEINLWVNGQHVLSVEDTSIKGGMVGYSVVSDAEPDFQVRFDNYRFARLYPIIK